MAAALCAVALLPFLAVAQTRCETDGFSGDYYYHALHLDEVGYQVSVSEFVDFTTVEPNPDEPVRYIHEFRFFVESVREFETDRAEEAIRFTVKLNYAPRLQGQERRLHLPRERLAAQQRACPGAITHVTRGAGSGHRFR